MGRGSRRKWEGERGEGDRNHGGVGWEGGGRKGGGKETRGGGEAGGRSPGEKGGGWRRGGVEEGKGGEGMEGRGGPAPWEEGRAEAASCRLWLAGRPRPSPAPPPAPALPARWPRRESKVKKSKCCCGRDGGRLLKLPAQGHLPGHRWTHPEGTPPLLCGPCEPQ